MKRLAVGVFVLLVGCARSSAPGPAPLDTRHERCHSCQMMVSDQRTAAQIVAPGEEAIFFDDLGCLSSWLGKQPRAPGATIYVADHRTREWVPADKAVFTRAPELQTPMGSHLIGHASEASRDQDPSARPGEPVPAREVVGDRQRGSQETR